MTTPDRVDTAAIRAARGGQGHPWRAADNPLTEMPEPERLRRLGVPLPGEAEQAAIDDRRAQALALHRQARAAMVGAPASFDARGRSVGRNCDNGWLPLPALEMIRDIGVTFEDYFPYTPGNSGGAILNGDWPNRLARAVQVANVTADLW